MTNMTYKTINVTQETYTRLAFYKHSNMTFDALLNDLMDMIDEEMFYGEKIKEHRKIMAEMKRGRFLTKEELNGYLDS